MPTDARLDSKTADKVARKVLAETLRVKKGEAVTVETWSNGLPFALKVVTQARGLGCIPVLLLEDEQSYLEAVRNPNAPMGVMGKHEYAMLSATDAYVFIPGPPIGLYSKQLEPSEKDSSTRYNRSWYEAAEKAGLRGARLSFGYAGEDMASIFGKKIEEIVSHQLEGALVDLKTIQRSAKSVAEKLSDGTDVNLMSDGSRLEFRLKGEVTVDDGVVDDDDVKKGENMHYFPAGYVAKGVEAGTASGEVRIRDCPTRLGIVKDATLTFKEGRLSGWISRSDDKALRQLIGALDPSKRVLSSFTIGLNPELDNGYGVDRMVGGSVSLLGFGIAGFPRDCTLTAGGKPLVRKGKLVV